jgi:hypothetical protein
MPDNVEKFIYQGPNTDWRPQIGGLDRVVDTRLSTQNNTGYHDLGYLVALLDQTIADTGRMYAECESQLSDYALVIDTNNEELVAAHAQAYPSDTTPGSITFDEYKYLLEHNNSNASQYVITSYENKVRGSSGTNALDISLLSLYINSECKRIKEFINAYIGEVDDSSEFRTIEVFQDWAEDAQAVISELWAALKGEIQRSIPQPELDRVTETKAGEFQALFQVKLNAINKNILNQFNQLSKNWDAPSKTFYNKNLGPAMKFRLKVGRSIGEGMDSTNFPVLSAEASGTTVGLDSNFEVTLADCIKRNNMFFDLVVKIMTNLAQRDSYIKYVGQLSNKGKPVTTPFVKSDSVDQADAIIEARVLDADRSISTSAQSFFNPHSDLNGLLDDDAHEQYLLRSGGDRPITGDIAVEDGVTIDGVDISEHTHDGVNSKKIRGADLEFGTITTDNLDLSGTATAVPSNLTIESIQSNLLGPGQTAMEVVVSFDVDTTGITGYEFEIVKLD